MGLATDALRWCYQCHCLCRRELSDGGPIVRALLAGAEVDRGTRRHQRLERTLRSAGMANAGHRSNEIALVPAFGRSSVRLVRRRSSLTKAKGTSNRLDLVPHLDQKAPEVARKLGSGVSSELTASSGLRSLGPKRA